MSEEIKDKEEFDYEELFKVQSKLAKILKKVCPKINYSSGIYFYTRVIKDFA